MHHHRGQANRDIPRQIIKMTLVVALLAVLTACGNSANAPSASNKLGLLEPGVLTITTNLDYRPFGFQQDGELVGFDVDIAKAVADAMGLKAHVVAAPFDTMIQGVQSGRYDVIIASMAITPKRAQAVTFSDPYYQAGGQMFVRKGSSCTNPKKMEPPVVGVARGTTYGDYAEEQAWIKDVKTYESSISAFADLQRGRLDGVITGKLSGLFQVKTAHKPLRTCGEALYQHPAAFALQKGSDKLLKALNNALHTIKENGTYLKISKKWFGQDIS